MKVEFVPAETAWQSTWWRIMVDVPDDAFPHTAGSISEIVRARNGDLFPRPIYRIRYVFELHRKHTDCPTLDEAKRIATAEVQHRADAGTLVTGRPEWLQGQSTL